MAEEKTEAETGNLKEEVQTINAELYEKRKSELSEIEARVDKKIKELTTAVDDYRKEGRALAGLQQTKKEETPKEYAERVLRGELDKKN